jgi:adenylate kinase
MNIILIGPQGSGKGTQAQILKRRHHYIYISTGNLLRKLAKSNRHSTIQSTKEGELVSDDIINKLVDDEISKHHTSSIIYDGYPRTLNQAKHLISMLGETIQNNNLIVIYLELDDSEAINRISKRLTCIKCGFVAYPNKLSLYQIFKICPNCHGTLATREDDNEKVVAERLRLFHNETFPIIEYLSRFTPVSTVDGNQSISHINLQIEKIIHDRR